MTRFHAHARRLQHHVNGSGRSHWGQIRLAKAAGVILSGLNRERHPLWRNIAISMMETRRQLRGAG
jgi:hypothetical protein